MCFCSYRASLRDIAEAKAIALTSNAHFGKIYNLNGPELLSGPKVASIWSTLLGKEIRYTGHDMDAFEEQMRKRAPSLSNATLNATGGDFCQIKGD